MKIRYTKKVMGRSGTGLGMAVVWGAVKDHKGYIDVQSVEGKGTTLWSWIWSWTRESTASRPTDRCLMLYPRQRAVIASGFSETSRVREAQSLGAGLYLKKPYTLGKLAEAVRKELDRAWT